MGWNIDKTIEFCYGHRVWSQELNGEFAKDLKCACRHLHGHEGKVQIYLSSDTLERGMVTDFRHLEWLKKFIDTYIDHQFLIDINDPAWKRIVPQFNYPLLTEDILVPGTLLAAAKRFRLTPGMEGMSESDVEILEGITIVNFVPTSENLSQWLHAIVNAKMNMIGVTCTKVDWWETPKSRSSFEG